MATISTLDEILIQAASGRTGWKLPAYAVATSNNALSGLPTLDSVSVPTGESVLLTAQSSGAQNGLWTVSSGAWTRRSDADLASKLPHGATVMVTHGAVNANSFWTLQTDNIILENTAQTWALNAIFPSSSIDTAATPNTLLKRGTSGQGTLAWLETGTAPLAASGDLRGSKTHSFKVRRADNGANVNLLTMGGFDDLTIGDQTNLGSIILGVKTGGTIPLQVNGTSAVLVRAGGGVGSVASAGTLCFQRGFSITSKNNAGSGDLTILSTDSSDNMALGTGGIGTLNLGPGTVLWGAGSTPTIQQSTQTSDVATANLTITPQAPFSTATGTNRNPGNLVIALADPTNGGTVVPSVQIKTGSSTYISFGKYTTAGNGAFWVGPAAPSASNYVFLGDGSSVTNLNAPSGGSATITFGGAINTGIDITSTTVQINPVTLQWPVAAASATIKQLDLTTGSGTGATLTIQAQNETGTTSVGGALVSTSGTGTSRRGANRLQIGGTTEVEIAEVVAGNKVVALCRDANLSSTEMPANSGNLVTYIGNAATAPTANSVSGVIFYSESGILKYRDTSGFIVTV